MSTPAVINNTATATAHAPDGSSVPSNPSSTSTPVSQRPIPTLTKTAAVTDVNGDGKTDLGDVVTWAFKVENTGTVTLSIILVTDPTAGGVTCPTTALAPGASMTCTAAPHTITRPTSTPASSRTRRPRRRQDAEPARRCRPTRPRPTPRSPRRRRCS